MEMTGSLYFVLAKAGIVEFRQTGTGQVNIPVASKGVLDDDTGETRYWSFRAESENATLLSIKNCCLPIGYQWIDSSVA